MPAKVITPIGLPVISDGHQWRLTAAERLGALDGTVCRLLLVEGAAATLADGSRRRLDPPVLLVLPPRWRGTVHLGRGGFCYRFDIDGGPGLVALLGGLRLWEGPAVRPWQGEIIALAQRWWRSLASRQPVAVHLLSLLLRLCDEPDESADGALAVRFQRLVAEHIGSGERAPSFARRLGVSRITLDRALRAASGTTAAGWLRQTRLRLAADLLREGIKTVAAVAAASGFADPDSFARAFRRQYGRTPREWRRR